MHQAQARARRDLPQRLQLTLRPVGRGTDLLAAERAEQHTVHREAHVHQRAHVRGQEVLVEQPRGDPVDSRVGCADAAVMQQPFEVGALIRVVHVGGAHHAVERASYIATQRSARPRGVSMKHPHARTSAADLVCHETCQLLEVFRAVDLAALQAAGDDLQVGLEEAWRGLWNWARHLAAPRGAMA